MLTVNLLGGKQFKQGHLSLGSWKWILVDVKSCGKNALSVLTEWKKPYVKPRCFMIFTYRIMCERKLLTVTSDNMTLWILFTMEQ